MKIYPPNVNKSAVAWSLAGKTSIRKGLSSIDGIGEKAAEELVTHQPYDSISDIAERCGRAVTGRKSWLSTKDIKRLDGTLAALHDAGALEGINHD